MKKTVQNVSPQPAIRDIANLRRIQELRSYDMWKVPKNPHGCEPWEHA